MSKDRQRRHVAALDVLEARAMLTLGIAGIVRTASISMLNQQIVEDVALEVGSDGGLHGSTKALIGYLVPNTAPDSSVPDLNVRLGGVGLKVSLQGDAGASAKVSIDWGEGQPTFASSAFTLDGLGQGYATMPWAYLNAGVYTATITATAGVETALATVRIDVGHFLDDTQGTYVRATQGDDSVRVQQRHDGSIVISTSFGAGTYRVGSGDKPLYVDGLAGNDQIRTHGRVMRPLSIDGGLGNDLITGGLGDDRLRGGPGDDNVTGNAGDDWLFGDEGRDSLNGSQGNDLLHGGTGTDSLIGGDGSDGLFGDDGDDLQIGQGGLDLLVGGLGRDSLRGGAGWDVLIGGYDNTYFQLDTAEILSRWAALDTAAVTAILAAPVTWGDTDLSMAPNTVVVNPQSPTTNPPPSPYVTMIAAGSFGTSVLNDGVVDLLDGGQGRNYVLRSAFDQDVVVRSPGVSTIVDQPGDKPNARGSVDTVPGFRPSTGVDLVGQATRTTFVLGGYYSDTAGIIQSSGFVKVPDVDDRKPFIIQTGMQRPGEFQLLNVDTSGVDFWNRYNRPFLATGMGFRAPFEMSSEPFDPLNVNNFFNGGIATRHREFRYVTGDPIPADAGTRPEVEYAYDPVRKIIYPVASSPSQPLFQDPFPTLIDAKIKELAATPTSDKDYDFKIRKSWILEWAKENYTKLIGWPSQAKQVVVSGLSNVSDFEMTTTTLPRYFSNSVFNIANPEIKTSVIGSRYTYKSVSGYKGNYWVDYANVKLGGGAFDNGLAQEETMVLESPELANAVASSNGYLTRRSSQGESVGVREGSPVPLVIVGVNQVVELTEPSPRPTDRYWWAKLDKTELKQYVRDLTPQTYGANFNVLAMAAPDLRRKVGGKTFTGTEIEVVQDLFNTFVAGFVKASGHVPQTNVPASQKVMIHTGGIGTGVFQNNKVVVYALQCLAARHVGGVDLTFYEVDSTTAANGQKAYQDIVSQVGTGSTIDRLMAVAAQVLSKYKAEV